MRSADTAPGGRRGCTVVVRRPAADGFEYLVRHRDADPGWTAPAGPRQPGEAVLTAALRILAEQAGILGAELWPVDLSGEQAVFAADVPVGASAGQRDCGLAGWEWVPLEVATTRLSPVDGLRPVTTAPRRRIGFRAMTHDDLPDLVSWRQAPHAARWFDGPADLEQAKARFGARIDGATPHRMHVAELDGLAVGHLFHYLVRAYPDYLGAVRDPDAAGIDFVIGDPDLCGRGLGPQVIWSYVRDVVLADHLGVPRTISSPEPGNTRAVRALEKAGFVAGRVMEMPEDDPPEQLCVLDVQRQFGAAGQ